MADSPKSDTNASRRRFLKYAGAGVVALAAAGIGGYEVYNNYLAPKPPLTIAWWGGSELDALQPAIQQFKQETGSDVNVILHSGGSSNTIPKIAAAWPNVVIDLIGISTSGGLKLAQQGFSIPLSATDVPALSNYPDNLYVKFNGTNASVAFATVSTVIVWRNDKIQDPITSFHDLMRPELKKHVAVGDPTGGAGMYLLSWCLDYGGDENNVDPGFTALQQLGQQGNLAMVWSEEPFALNAMQSGDIWAMEYSDYGTGGLIAKNAAQYSNISILKNPAGGKAVFDADTLAIINGPRKDLAMKFADIFLAPDMQAKFAPVNGEAPANPLTPMDPTLEPWVNSGADLKKYGYFANRQTVAANIDSWAQRFDQQIRPLVSA